MQQWSPVYRIVVLLLPAFYCSWTAFRLTLEATSSSSSFTWANSSEEVEQQFIQTRLFQPNQDDDDRPPTDGENVADPTRVDCFAFNSQKWLEGPRMGNSNATSSTSTQNDDDPVVFTPAAPTPINLLQSILQQQSLCRPESPFQSLLAAADTVSKTDPDTRRRLWTTRLLYLAVHLHQHGPALREAQHRRDHPQCLQQFTNVNVNSFDYECPTARFLVVSFYKNGIGANMRLAAVPALMAGLATDRIVLFVNHAPTGPAFLREPWTLASCPRRDAQCFFRPASPCVLTHDELSTAYQLPRGEMRRVFRHGELPAAHARDRVLVLHLSFRPQREPDNLRTVLYNLSQTVIERIVSGSTTGESLLVSPTILRQAADAILVDDHSNDGLRTSNGSTTTANAFNYYGANSPIFHSLLMYAMRPNPTATQEMNRVLEEMFPRYYDAPNALGLPIRASDKCGVESECLSFAEHVAAAQALWAAVSDGNDYSGKRTEVDIVVTSESQQILRERETYSAASLLHNESFRARFIVNHRDVTQNTGYLEDIIASSSSSISDSTNDHNATSTTADLIMLSALSSLQAQLQTRVALGNCCSNFHLLLKDLMDEGCGATVDSRFQCLQDHRDPAYRVCCAWDKSARCLARRRRQQQQQQNNETLSSEAR